MINVTSEVEIYEADGKDSNVPFPVITIKNHWNRTEMIVIRIDDGPEVTVLARDLRAAIENCINTARF